MPTFWVLKNKERQTGVSVFFVDEGIDTGPILVQKIIDINTNSLYKLIKLSKQIGMLAIIQSIEKLLENEEPILIENDLSDGSYYGFPEAQDVRDFLSNGRIF